MRGSTLGVLVVLLATGASAGEGDAAAAIRPSVFGPGEQTTYEVSFLGIPAGLAQITVGWTMEQFGREVWPLVCVGQTTNVASPYQLKDRFVSYWDPRAQVAMGADYFVDENHHRRRERYRYDFTDQKAYRTRQREGADPTDLAFDIAPGTMDLAATAFRLRNVPLVVGAVHALPIFTGDKAYWAKATVVARERLETRLGAIDVFRVTFNGDFSGSVATRGLMTIFYTADERQLPVKGTVEFVVGSVVVEAVKYAPGRSFAAAP